MRDPRAKCKTPHCRNVRRKAGRDCSRCHQRAWRANRPYQAAYATLRDHARERGIPFTITVEDFRKFAVETDYVERTGLYAQCLTVDRVKNTRGYEPGNLQPLTREENSRKRCRQDEVRMRTGFSWRRAA